MAKPPALIYSFSSVIEIKKALTRLYLFILSLFDSLVDVVQDRFATFSSFLHLFSLLTILCGKTRKQLEDKTKTMTGKQKSFQTFVYLCT